jgi:hypothetical protein
MHGIIVGIKLTLRSGWELTKTCFVNAFFHSQRPNQVFNHFISLSLYLFIYLQKVIFSLWCLYFDPYVLKCFILIFEFFNNILF